MTTATDNRYFEYPKYGSKSTKTSGVWMEVTLGPEAVDSTNYGTKTNSASISSHMRPLNEKDYLLSAGNKSGLWVAGHLLNDNLGGSGTSSENLTPLTQTANKQHAGLEGKIKSALIVSAQLLKNYPNIPFVVGVHYKVEVSKDVFGDFAPYNKAPSHITVTASLVKVSKKTRDITPLGILDWGDIPSHQSQYLKNSVFNVVIDNKDEHLLKCNNVNCGHV